MGASERRARLHDTARASVREDRPIIITTLATQNYLPRAQWCVNYLNANADPGSAWLGAVGCDPCGELELGHVGCYLVPSGMLDRSLGNPGNGCIQHGNWLPYLRANDNAVVICIDGDVKMQRPFSASERAMLSAWPDGAIGIGPNEPVKDNMINELCRIKPLLDEQDIRSYYGVSEADPIGNAGCVVATRRTWIDLWLAYLRTWLDTAPNFAHIAVQQWTLNLCINRHFERVVLPQTFHTHGHWGYPGAPYDGWGEDGVATVGGEVILFAHKTW